VELALQRNGQKLGARWIKVPTPRTRADCAAASAPGPLCHIVTWTAPQVDRVKKPGERGKGKARMGSATKEVLEGLRVAKRLAEAGVPSERIPDPKAKLKQLFD
jgi:hypothetical protein